MSKMQSPTGFVRWTVHNIELPIAVGTWSAETVDAVTWTCQVIERAVRDLYNWPAVETRIPVDSFQAKIQVWLIGYYLTPDLRLAKLREVVFQMYNNEHGCYQSPRLYGATRSRRYEVCRDSRQVGSKCNKQHSPSLELCGSLYIPGRLVAV
ncbi:hypothetical protein GQ600_6518 [Phytophthora cactorum]|nr:hypothetical protein GQ600_6518 [Phytophthora cactorum]